MKKQLLITLILASIIQTILPVTYKVHLPSSENHDAQSISTNEITDETSSKNKVKN